MKRMDYSEGYEMLLKAGFKAIEIEQLSKLRRDYIEQEMYQMSIAHPKHETWLERVRRKISTIGQHLADSGDVFWTHDHLLW